MVVMVAVAMSGRYPKMMPTSTSDRTRPTPNPIDKRRATGGLATGSRSATRRSTMRSTAQGPGRDDMSEEGSDDCKAVTTLEGETLPPNKSGDGLWSFRQSGVMGYRRHRFCQQ